MNSQSSATQGVTTGAEEEEEEEEEEEDVMVVVDFAFFTCADFSSSLFLLPLLFLLWFDHRLI